MSRIKDELDRFGATLDALSRANKAASALPPPEPQGTCERSRPATCWGQLSERTRNRLEEMIACGVPRDSADVAVTIIKGIGADNADWSIFADIKADPPVLELWHEKTGTHIECSVLGGPNVRHEPRDL